MVNCAFHPENPAPAELNVEDRNVGHITIPICKDCVEAYDKICAKYEN